MADPRNERRVRVGLCGSVAFVAVMVLVGWASDVGLLKTVLPGLTTMKANTAVGLLAASLGLIGLDATVPRFAKAARGLAIVAGAGTTALGLATLTEYVGGVSFGIDELLVADPATTSAPFNGRMSPATAIGFVGLGASAVALNLGAKSAPTIAHAAALPALVLGALSLTGYAYGVERLYNFGPYVSVAVNTAVSLCALAVAALLSRADDGWRRSFVGRPAARAALALLLPWSVLIPFAAGLLVLEGARVGFYAPLFAPALLAVATACAFVAFSFMAAASARRIEARQEVLSHELSHRMKNLLAMVQSIAVQTMRGAPDLDTAKDVLADRLVALGRAHDLLMGGALSSTSLGAVIRDALAVHTDHPARFRIGGPDLEIGADHALSLALMLHELATNAAKYGALSNAAGLVEIGWQIVPEAAGPQLRLTWRETGGPPVRPPVRKGFGTRFIERGLATRVGGHLTLDFRPGGVVCALAAPLAPFQSDR